MIGRFSYYRRRRVLPLSAVYCLVFINGATLAPLVLPAVVRASGTADSRDARAERGADECGPRLNYERGGGEQREPTIAVSVPPIVKNLRRPAPTRHFGAACCRGNQPATDSPKPESDFVQRALAANAASLTRLCRLLL